MKIKVILGVILLVGVGIGSYVYKNRYSFFKYLLLNIFLLLKKNN